MAKIAFIFPGQGSQTVGMGKALYDQFPEAKAVLDAADDALSEKLTKLCFEGPEAELKLTANTQPAILAVSVAAHAVFTKRFPSITASFVAGHSLGEYSALVAAGAMSLPDAVKSVRARGTFMQEAVPNGVGAMAAVVGLDPAKVKEVCEAAAQGEVVSPANFNDPQQIVIAGHAKAVERASHALKEAGARRVLLLPVSAPFHCSLMQPVVQRLDEVLSKIQFSGPTVPVVTNVEAAPNTEVSRVKKLLLEQVTGSVRWVETVQYLEREGVTKVYELGPGHVLCGLNRRISKNIEVAHVEDPGTLEKAGASV